ncbi:hypothetical protein [Enterobacter sp.]|uniref:hypothetical protein n=1 Tax=Enterobacter sp. TaxID=42895 RepID=UPI0031DE9ACE
MTVSLKDMQQQKAPAVHEALVDRHTPPDYSGELLFSSDKKISLICGKSSITLYPNGKIVLKGDYILSDAEGVNRLAGGRIDIN